MQYHADFEENKWKYTQVAEDAEIVRLQKNQNTISSVLGRFMSACVDVCSPKPKLTLKTKLALSQCQLSQAATQFSWPAGWIYAVFDCSTQFVF